MYWLSAVRLMSTLLLPISSCRYFLSAFPRVLLGGCNHPWSGGRLWHCAGWLAGCCLLLWRARRHGPMRLVTSYVCSMDQKGEVLINGTCTKLVPELLKNGQHLDVVRFRATQEHPIQILQIPLSTWTKFLSCSKTDNVWTLSVAKLAWNLHGTRTELAPKTCPDLYQATYLKNFAHR